MAPPTPLVKQATSELMAVEDKFSAFIDEDRDGRMQVDISPTALCDAAASNDVDGLRKIVQAGGDVNKGDYDRRTAIHLAASEGKLEVVRFLVEEAGADHSPADRWGGTPLDDAARHAHTAVATYLKSKGATSKAKSKPSSSMCSLL